MSLGQVDNPSLWDVAGGEMPPVLAPSIPTLATHSGDIGQPGTMLPSWLFEPYVAVGTIDSEFQVAGTSYGYKNAPREQGIVEWLKNNKTAVYAGVATIVALTFLKK